MSGAAEELLFALARGEYYIARKQRVAAHPAASTVVSSRDWASVTDGVEPTCDRMAATARRCSPVIQTARDTINRPLVPPTQAGSQRSVAALAADTS